MLMECQCRNAQNAEEPQGADAGPPSTFEYLEASDRIDLTLGGLDDPARFRPTAHFGAESLHEAWSEARDLLRQRSDDYARPIECWGNAVGRLSD